MPKRQLLFALLILGLSTTLSVDAQPSSRPTALPADPQQLESKFVSFSPARPTAPGQLDLSGYETSQIATSTPLLSPDKSMMAYSEAIFFTKTRQTYGRVYISPVGKLPEASDILTPRAKAEADRRQQNGRRSQPTLTLNDVNPSPFWQRYQPQTSQSSRQLVFEVGMDNPQPYHFDAVQVIDWSRGGEKLLMAYRPGIHHTGIYRTVPIIYNRQTGETVRMSFLPDSIWGAALSQFPELKSPENRVWDIRLLGWDAQNPEALLVKLVMFEGQSELPVGLWRYTPSSGDFTALGNTTRPDMLGRNGWLVQYHSPASKGAQAHYGPGKPPTFEIPERESDTRSLWDKLRFRKERG